MGYFERRGEQERHRSGNAAARAALIFRLAPAHFKCGDPPALNEDLYLNFAGASNDGEGTVLQSYVFRLVSWIWIGYWGVLIGTIICLIPGKRRLIYPRTEVVAVAGKHAQVEK